MDVVSRPEVLNHLLGLFDRPSYLEIGVNRGETFLAIEAARRVAVDPHFLFSIDAVNRDHTASTFHEVTSDAYFAELASQNDVFQVIYLDGLHTFEQTLRDFTNAIQFLSPDGLIVIDDVAPNSYQASLPDQRDALALKSYTGNPDNSWMGDTYKLVFFIESFFPTFQLRTIADNHGQAVVWRADRVRKNFRSYSVHEIAALAFIDVIKQDDVFHRKAFAEILAEVEQDRRGVS